MRHFKILVVVIFLVITGYSCGVPGDPGHCFFALDWEYYYDGYGVTYYEDDNPNLPLWTDIERGFYYECYPGIYNYYYESEDRNFYYTYNGTYELIQIPGTRGGLFTDGMDGADTNFDLYLLVEARKSLVLDKVSFENNIEPLRMTFQWEETKDHWKILVKGSMNAVPR